MSTRGRREKRRRREGGRRSPTAILRCPIIPHFTCSSFSFPTPSDASHTGFSFGGSSQSTVHSPQSAVHSPQNAVRSPQSAVHNAYFTLTGNRVNRYKRRPFHQYEKQCVFITKTKTILFTNRTSTALALGKQLLIIFT